MTRQSYNIKTANRSFENIAKLKYLRIQNLIHEEIKSRLNSGDACYHSVQKLLFSFLLFKNVKIKICKNIILREVLYDCETWSLTLRKEYGLRVFEKRVLRRIFGLKRDEVIGDRRKFHNEKLHNLYSSPNNQIYLE
jgi:hypothetical protein